MPKPDDTPAPGPAPAPAPGPPGPKKPKPGHDLTAKPAKADKDKTVERLKAKKVDEAQARHLAGADEDLSAQDIAARRIAWQKQLPKAP